MRVKAVTIHNFRTFRDGEISLSPFSTLVGANNSGKSNLIDALRVFYEKDLKFSEDRDFPKFPTENRESWMEIEYLPSEEELRSLKDEYRLPQGTFRVRKYFRSDEKDSDGKTKNGIYAYVGGELSDSRFYGAKNVQQGKLGSVVFIPAVSKLADTTKLTGPSPFRDLLNVVVNRVLKSSTSYSALTGAFDQFEASFKTESTDDGRSLEALESEISSELQSWGARFEIVIDPISPDEVVKTLIGHRVFDVDLDQAQQSDCYGQGFQRHLIYSLIRLAAQYSSERPKAVRKEFSPDLTLILFEEPEAFLHPSQIDVLAKSVRKLASTEAAQVLISTHNPLFVSRAISELPSLIRLHRDGARTRVHRLSEKKLWEVVSTNQADLEDWQESGIPIQTDDLREEMETVKYALWLDARRCASFFANRVLLVEGPTETALFGYLFDTGRLPTPKDGVFVFDALGKFNIHRFMNLFGELGISHSVLFDDDSGNRRCVADTIKNARNRYTIEIDSFPQDLEVFLGVPPPGNSHRKPQHMMFCISEGMVDDSKLDDLCIKIQNVLQIDSHTG
jgi:putative ATP-dependent endonuclease of OLD family